MSPPGKTNSIDQANKLKKGKPLSIVILPLPAQGHLNQHLHLALHLANRSLSVHYVGSSTHNRQARDRSSLHHRLPSVTSLHFHDFPLPPFPIPPPNPNSATTSFPSHLQPAFDSAILHLSPPLSSLLLSLSSSSRRVILIHDSVMSFAANLTLPLPNAESYALHSVSAYTNFFFHAQQIRSPAESTPTDSEQLTFEDCFSTEFLDFLRRQHGMAVKDHGRLLNTCRVMEQEFVEKLASESWKDQRVFAIGPLNPIKVEINPSWRTSAGHECIQWLDKQPKKSVLYVSFGTTSSLCTDQIRELASGLESSRQRFIWVLRNADRGDVYARGENEVEGVEATCGFERGIVVRDWAPQLEILGHESTGGFLTHCGWNSCMECMTMGVPMLTWPMHSDQPRNSVLVTEVLKVGVVGREWKRRKEMQTGDKIKDSIVRLMASEEGKEVRRTAEAVGEAIRRCGSSSEELDLFVAYISR